MRLKTVQIAWPTPSLLGFSRLMDPVTQYQDPEGNVTRLDPLGEGGVAGHGSGNPMAIAHLVNHPPEGVEP